VGEGGRYLQYNEFRSDGGVLGWGPTGEAIRSGECRYINDIAHDPSYEPWRLKAMDEAFASSAALPIIINGRVAGTLNFYSSQINFFDEKRRAFFGDLTLLLGEGIRKFRDPSKDRKTTPG
jgi:GAF domain-containing protein